MKARDPGQKWVARVMREESRASAKLCNPSVLLL
jgi:hypothetical protein